MSELIPAEVQRQRIRSKLLVTWPKVRDAFVEAINMRFTSIESNCPLLFRGNSIQEGWYPYKEFIEEMLREKGYKVDINGDLIKIWFE